MKDLYKVFISDDINLEDIRAILDSGQLMSGNYLKEFEDKLINYLGNRFSIVTNNNNYAYLVALATLGLTCGDEVIASPMACLASNMPVLNFGAKLVWADIDPGTGTLNPESVRMKISKKTKAILHYHWCGYPGYIDEINEIGVSEGIPVIDDATESFGSKYKGKFLGSLGSDITIFSFQTVRLPNSLEGGALAFKDENLFKKALRIRDMGIDRRSFRDEMHEISPNSDIPMFGYNAIMNEVNAYIGAKNIDKTIDLLQKQYTNSLIWDKYCDDQNLERLNNRPDIKPNYWVYSFKSKNQKESIKLLRSEGYYASKVHLRNDYYSCFGSFDSNLSGVDSFSNEIINVPCGWWVKV